MTDPGERPPVVERGEDRPPVVESRGTWANARDVFVAPARTFRAVRRDPAIAGPMILLVATSAAAIAVAMFAFAPAAEVMDDVLSASGLPGGAMSRVAVTAVGVMVVTVTVPLVALLVAGLLWAWSTVRDGGTRFTVALAAVLWSRMVVPLETVVNGFLAAATGRHLEGASLGPALLVDPGTVSRAAYAAVSKLDVFSIWVVVLTALAGIHAMGLGRRDAVAFAVVLWMVGVALAMAFAVVGGIEPSGAGGGPSL